MHAIVSRNMHAFINIFQVNYTLELMPRINENTLFKDCCERDKFDQNHETWGLFHQHGLTLIPTLISNQMSNNVWNYLSLPKLWQWDEIIYTLKPRKRQIITSNYLFALGLKQNKRSHSVWDTSADISSIIIWLYDNSLQQCEKQYPFEMGSEWGHLHLSMWIDCFRRNSLIDAN